MAESQAQVERSGTKENPSNRVPKQRVIDQAFFPPKKHLLHCVLHPLRILPKSGWS